MSARLRESEGNFLTYAGGATERKWSSLVLQLDARTETLLKLGKKVSVSICYQRIQGEELL